MMATRPRSLRDVPGLMRRHWRVATVVGVLGLAAALAWGPGWLRDRPYAGDSFGFDEDPSALAYFHAALRADHSTHAAEAASILDRALATAILDQGPLTVDDQARFAAGEAPTFIWAPMDHAARMPAQSFGQSVAQVEVLIGKTWTTASAALVIINFDASHTGYLYRIDPGAAATIGRLLYERSGP